MDTDKEDDLRPEYDLSKLAPVYGYAMSLRR